MEVGGVASSPALVSLFYHPAAPATSTSACAPAAQPHCIYERRGTTGRAPVSNSNSDGQDRCVARTKRNNKKNLLALCQNSWIHRSSPSKFQPFRVFFLEPPVYKCLFVSWPAVARADKLVRKISKVRRSSSPAVKLSISILFHSVSSLNMKSSHPFAREVAHYVFFPCASIYEADSQ